ncbi:MAG: DUF1638 domain-containing protein [Planctomycetes bacterium]|nr:DUF1638 domain-containing protein [Planctomycetota bacterium]
MKFKVIACGVFKGVLEYLAEPCANEIDIEYLEANLHAVPDTLNRKVTAAMARSEAKGCDAILLAYGLCNKGIVGLAPKDTTLVVPRAHDCITLFLGSLRRYREQFAKAPGTFYFSQCWVDNKGGPRTRRRQRENHPHYREFVEKYGSENAEFILDFYESWRKNYQRAAYIRQENDRPEIRDELLPAIRDMAEAEGWRFEEIDGDLSLLRDMLDGKWGPERFLVVRPGEKIVGSPGGDVIAALPLGAPQAAPAAEVRIPRREVKFDPGRKVVGLGIDAGGTYTDAVLYDFANDQVLSKAKSLTTKHDLTEGIKAAVDGLDKSRFDQISFIAISTTLATNAVVEGKVTNVGLLVLPPPGFRDDDIPHEPKIVLTARTAMDGSILQPLDENEVREAVRRLVEEERVPAIAVSGFASISNPLHELEVKRIIGEECNAPVLCGHELSMGLNFIRRANTAVLNAQLMPLVADLIDSVKRSLGERQIDAPVMIVKCDGTLVSEQVARDRPIETILSGPAASVVGATYLSKVRNGMVIDMGGTTSDIAQVRDGEVLVTPTGARLGGWATNVRAADIQTAGLGGDSYVQIHAGTEIAIGPKRVVPLAYLVHKYPKAMSGLRALESRENIATSNVQPTDFFVFVRDGRMDLLNPKERQIAEIVREGPLSRFALSRRLGLIHPSLLSTDRLENAGMIVRSSLTPTDVLHALGRFTEWDMDAASTGLEIYAKKVGISPSAMAQRILDKVRGQLLVQLLLKEFSRIKGVDAVPGCAVCEAIVRNILEGGKGWGFTSRISLNHPIVAIGAPVGAYFDSIGELLGTDVVIPDHAEVANAIGAATANVVIEEEISIRPTPEGSFVMHSSREKREFEKLADAKDYASRQVEEIVWEKGREAGASALAPDVRVRDRVSAAADGVDVLIESVVRGRIASKPVVGGMVE